MWSVIGILDIANSIFWTFLSGAPFKSVVSWHLKAPSFSFIAPCAHLLEGPNRPEGVDQGPRRGGLMVRSFIILVSFLILILILVLIISLIMLFLLLLPPLILLLLIIFILAIAGKFVFQPMRSAWFSNHNKKLTVPNYTYYTCFYLISIQVVSKHLYFENCFIVWQFPTLIVTIFARYYCNCCDGRRRVLPQKPFIGWQQS